MNQLFTRKMSVRGSKGFTLIELLVVIAIIGILASIVLASLNTARQKGRDARRIADIKQVQLALELYYDATGSVYPSATYAGLSAVLTPTYISTMPTDPGTGTYQYAGLQGGSGAAATCRSYHLGATLEVVGNSALNTDFDGTTGGTYGSGFSDGPVCTSSTDFAGAGQVYDVRP